MKKNSGFLKRNIFLILLILLTVYTGILYYLDNQNKVDVIKVEVDKNKLDEIQKEKNEEKIVKKAEKDLIDGKFLLLQKGKKQYFIVKAV